MALAPRQWFILLAFYTSYLIFGAAIFYQIEHELETVRRAQALQNRIDINELLVEYASPDDLEIQNAILDKVTEYCGKPVTNYTLDKYDTPYQWTFYHAVFFAFTVCSTLGYGNITPTQTFGRYFMILYALIGMPVNMILYAYLGEYFGSRFTAVYKRYKAYKMANNKNYVPRRLSMIAQITMTLIPATIILIFLPSCLFTYFEGWPYSVSVYYSFVTLATIGFGDFIPTFQAHQERTFGIYFRFYQIFILVWFVFGLSYILMLIGFIARGMRSKRIARLEQQLSDNIKVTHQKIWSGVTKDVGYLRRILNEIYLMKFRPVYSIPGDGISLATRQRSYSCPELIMYSTHSAYCPRKRALSENHGLMKAEIKQSLKHQNLSRHSETNLLRIDKERTFEQECILDNTADLLAKVVLALNEFNGSNEAETKQGAEQGYDLFSDSEILQDEGMKPLPRHATSPSFLRRRAISEFTGIRSLKSSEVPVWKFSEKGTETEDYPKKHSNEKSNGVRITIDNDGEDHLIENTGRRQSIFNKFNNIFRRRNTVHQDVTLSPLARIRHKKLCNTPIIERKNSGIFNDMKSHPNIEEIRRPSTFSLGSTSAKSENILENTTIADLIRAIENAHIKDHGIGLNDSSSLRRQSSVFNQGNVRDHLSLHRPSVFSIDPNLRRLSLHPDHNTYCRQTSAPPASTTIKLTPNMEQLNVQNLLNLSNQPMISNENRRFSGFSGHPNRIPDYLRSKSDQASPNYARRKTLLPMSPLALHHTHTAPQAAQPKIIVRKRNKRRSSQSVLDDKKNIRDLL